MKIEQPTSNEWPRVLVVGAASMNASTATGVTLMNLFSGWPLDQIAQIHSSTPPDLAICANSRTFTSDDVPLVRSAKRLLSTKRRIAVDYLPQAPAAGPHPLGILGACGDLVPIKLSPDILSWARAFRPQVIHSVLGSVRMMNITLQLSQKLDLPVVPHFMDDWPSTAYREGALMQIPRNILQDRLRSVLERAPVRLTIGRDMAKEYAHRYGGRFDFFMNCVEVGERPSYFDYESGATIRFGYVGGLHLNRWRSLLDVVVALQKMRDFGRSITLDIFVPEKDIETYGDRFSVYSVVGGVSSIPPMQIQARLLKFDALVHIESFLEEDSRYTRLSVSTKIPQYMASGRPILAYGPESISSIRYVEAAGAGLTIVTQGDCAEIAAQAERLRISSKLRRELGWRGHETALRNHLGESERARFRKVLASATDQIDAREG